LSYFFSRIFLINKDENEEECVTYVEIFGKPEYINVLGFLARACGYFSGLEKLLFIL